ncbi:hypothetical protein BDZ91DRAFT_718570 [Kalaharituber pfeilii]|nr:hypothetical protein BDZ91DRAFT_718570 [Kalaharituber pfeilii]
MTGEPDVHAAAPSFEDKPNENYLSLSSQSAANNLKPSLILTHISADATFLLSYRPLQHLSSATAPFTILFDPWLVGSSPVFHPSFSTQSHTITPSITHLSQLEYPPDVVLISQDKTDHCHEETLRQLDTGAGGRDENVRIWAVKGAVGRVRGWGIVKRAERVEELKVWKAVKGGKGPEERVVRVDIPVDMSGLESVKEKGLEEMYAHVEIVHLPAVYPWEFPSLHSAIGVRFVTRYTFRKTSRGGDTDIGRKSQETCTHTHLTLYTPHGVPPSAVLPYLSSLTSGNARATIDLLLHPFTFTTTPPHLGGKITLGIPNVLAIIRAGVRIVVLTSAHDEKKDVGGYVSSKIKCRRWSVEDVVKEVREALIEVNGEASGERTEVWELGNGEVREVLQ